MNYGNVLPIMWINRRISNIWQKEGSPLSAFPVWLVVGPRQVGKSSLLEHHREPQRQCINLDDLAVRQRAQQDPVFFMQDLTPPLIIDEIQYAPELLSQIKIIADRKPGAGAVWLTGSQSLDVMKGVRESLAGRVGIVHLLGLADDERPWKSTKPEHYFHSILQSTFPAVVAQSLSDSARELYLSSYLQTYVERDVVALLGIQKRREFEIFLRMCALRTGQLLNVEEVARDASIAPATARDWLSVLEASHLIRLIEPYYRNRTKRMIKSPKLYFLDSGLAAYLAGWRTVEQIQFGPMSGALFETHILGNIIRHYWNQGRDARVYFWRTRDQDEVDFIVERTDSLLAIEVRLGNVDQRSLLPLSKLGIPEITQAAVVSAALMGQNSVQLNQEWRCFSPADLVGLL